MFYPVKITYDDGGTIIGSVRDIPQCYFSGPTEEEALEHCAMEIYKSLELNYRRERLPIPLPTKLEKGEWPINIPLRQQLKILLWNELLRNRLTLSEFARNQGINNLKALRLVCLTTDEAKTDTIEGALHLIGCHITAKIDE